MTEYKTGEKAPYSGIYGYVRHMNGPYGCKPTPDEMQIPLSVGERFPPHKSCSMGVIWSLLRRT
ncbi:MAG: YjzC family protein [Euryarchaeota archaeon]|nr:YjzC family protein [Euryarchaeota archaeon]